MLAVLASAFVLTSPVLAQGHALPARFTCDGSDVSPPLSWTAPPAGTTTLSLRLVDLDTTPQFRHWLVSGIPTTMRSLGAGSHVGNAAENTFGRSGYGGPCPPPGQTHRYLFTLTALDRRGKLLASARLLVTYRRR